MAYSYGGRKRLHDHLQALTENTKQRVVHVAAECVPFVKVGGLGDVVGALPLYAARGGYLVTVVIPGYVSVLRNRESTPVHSGQFTYQRRVYPYRVRRLAFEPFEVLAIEIPDFFDAEGIYVSDETGRPFTNGAHRFLVFQLSVVDAISEGVIEADVFHIHDHHTALIPALLGDPSQRFVFTVHSADHQGVYPVEHLTDMGLDLPHASDSGDTFNSMQVGLKTADAITTVSPGYAAELRTDDEMAHGLRTDFADAGDRFKGILNGIDPNIWNPETDELIPHNYRRRDLSGKLKNKIQLCESLALDAELPLIVFIGRLMEEKGVEVLLPFMEWVVEGTDSLNVAVLGTGKPEFEARARDIVSRPGTSERVALTLAFDNELAHLMYAAGNMLLMPSRSEPCGLNQMYAQAYGTVPIVNAVGGLADTVEEWNNGAQSGTGFRFEEFTLEACVAATRRAVSCYHKPDSWSRLVDNVMSQDNTWTRSSSTYLDLYSQIV